MSFFLVKQTPCVKGNILLLGDKSIAIRSIIISALSQGKTVVENFPSNKDSLFTVKTFRRLGIKIKQNQRIKTITVYGKGLHGFKKPKGPVFVGDSGTTMRLTLGILAGQNFAVTLTVGRSLSNRPMLRVNVPLRMMGAAIKSKVIRNKFKVEEYPPITITGAALNPVNYKVPVASAQVKSALLLAGLYATGTTRIREPIKTRDHTERMLKLFKAAIRVRGNTIAIKGNKKLTSPGRIFVPGDISSAAFFMVLGAILPNSKICIKNVSLNSTRTGIVRILKRMGADIQAIIHKPQAANYEPMGDLIIKSSNLKGTAIKREEIPSLIDELPILMVAASYAKGVSVFKGVSELRVKETDRVKSMSENLKRMGAGIRLIKTPKSEDIVIHGGRPLTGTTVKSFADHRTAMSMVIAGLAAKGQTRIDDIACINKSFPNFLSLLKAIIHN